MKPSKLQSEINRAAVHACVQILYISNRQYTIDALRDLLKQLGDSQAAPELRGMARIGTFELVEALAAANQQLAAAGLHIRIDHAGAKLETVQVQNPRLANLLSSYAPESTPTTITEETLTVLACIAFKQPISQIEIDRMFDREMRYYVNKLRGMDLVNERIGPDSRLHFVTTAEFLRRFNIQSPADLHALLQTQTQAAPGLTHLKSE